MKMIHTPAFKKVTAGLLAVTSMSALAVGAGTAFAADGDPAPAAAPGITISGDKAQLANHTVKYLKIGNFNDVSEDGTGYDVTSTLNADQQKVFDDAVKSIDKNAQKNADDENLTLMQYVTKYWVGNGTDQYGNAKSDNANLRKLADVLKNDKNIADAATDNAKPAGDGTTITIPVEYGAADDDNHGGLYLIIDQGGQNDGGNNTSSNSLTMIVGSQIQKKDGTFVAELNGVTLGQINVKNDLVTINKERTGVNNGTDANDVAGVGDTVHFKLDGNVPSFNDWPMVTKADDGSWTKDSDAKEPDWGKDGISFNDDDVVRPKSSNVTIDGQTITANGPLYRFVDNPVGFEKIDTNTVKVIDTTDENKPVTLKEDAYTVTSTDPDSTGKSTLTVTLKDAYSYKGHSLIVTYDAKVADTAAANDKTSNSAKIDWSNNPYDQTSVSQGGHSETENPLADIQWNKYDWGTSGNHGTTNLDGAVFTLQNADGKYATFTKSGDVYVFTGTWADNTSDATNLTTADGKGLEVKGLPEGSFTVTETKAPDGYILGQGDKQMKFTVTIDNVDGKTDVKYVYSSVAGSADFVGKGWVANTNADNKSTASIYNTKNIGDMPKTGGQFLTVAAIAGGFIILGLGAGIVAKKSKNA